MACRGQNVLSVPRPPGPAIDATGIVIGAVEPTTDDRTSMSSSSADASKLPRRSGRATAALILGFVTMAGLTIIGHLDRVGPDPEGTPFEESGDLPAIPTTPGSSTTPAGAPISGVVVVDRSSSSDSEGASVHLDAPVAWKQALAPGSSFQFHVDQTGHQHRGRVLALDDGADPAQRTVRVIGTVHDSEAMLRPGMSGSARFDDGGQTALSRRR